MICSNCGAPLAPDAGFCRGCGAILRGKAASAVPIPAAVTPPPAGASAGPGSTYPPTTTPAGDRMPPPPPPALSDAGFWGSPAQADGMFQGQQIAPPAPSPNGPPGSPPGLVQAPPPGWAGLAHLGSARAMQQVRYRQRLHMLDVLQCIAAAAVLGSLFMPWYQLGISRGGVGVNVSYSALSSPAGGWRWLILVVAVVILLEGMIAVVAKVSETGAWRHAEVQAVLGVVLVGLVIGAFFASPFPDFASVVQIPGLDRSVGPGVYLGIVSAVLAGYAGIGRFFVAPPRDLQ